ncbi:MAG: RNA-binding protein [Patescibacteria group bacterium]
MEDQNSQKKLFVGNLSYDLTDEQLKAVFTGVEGLEVEEATVHVNRFTGRPSGFGFVTMATPEMAQKAIAELNNKDVGGRPLRVDVSRPRENNDRGGDNRHGSDNRDNR